MSLIPVVTDEEANEEQAELFQHCEALLGRVSDAYRIAAHTPKVAHTLLGFMMPALRSEITGAVGMDIKVLVILKTSMLNGCAYCVGHNTALGRAVGYGDEEIAALEGDTANSPLFTPAQKAAIAWAECLTLKTYRQKPEVMAELKKHFTSEQIVEITMVSGFFNFWNRFTDGLQVDIEPPKQVGMIGKSKTVNLDAYLDFMNSGWWTKPGAGSTGSPTPSD